jgi:HD superfamily phosphodiesterase
MWYTLSDFVRITCEGRDPSHGHQHMEQVALNSLHIFKELSGKKFLLNWNNHDQLRIIITVAWLHDVADHKYDNDGTLEHTVKSGINNFFYKKEDQDLVWNIINRISFSKENKARLENKTLDWDDVLGIEGKFIRNIVSDVDKLEAIGQIGIDRCIMYSKEKYLEKYGHNISNNELIKEVKIHADEKLLRLKDEFIHTEPGKKMAEPLHQEMVDFLNSPDFNI